MSLGYIVDKLLDEHGLADAGTPEEADLAALEIGFEQVDDFDSGIKHLLGSREVGEFGRLAVNREGVVGLEGTEAVDRVARDIHDPAPDLGAHRHGDRRAGGRDFQPPAEAVRRIHRHAAHGVLAYVLLNFKYKLLAVRPTDLESFMDGGQCPRLADRVYVKVNVDNGADYLGDDSPGSYI